jgi:hypothetical protein
VGLFGAIDVGIARKALGAFAMVHAAGAAFAVAQFILFPEQVVDLVPDRIALSDVRYAVALLAVLPSTFLAWDVVLLIGLRRGERLALLVGFISGGAAIVGTTIHAAFAQWSTMVIDGSMGIVFLALTPWAWKTWSTPMPAEMQKVNTA